MSRLPVVLAVLFLLSFAFAETQKPSSENLSPSAFKLRSVKVTGTSRYKPEDVMRAAKLQLGQPLHDDDLKTRFGFSARAALLPPLPTEPNSTPKAPN